MECVQETVIIRGLAEILSQPGQLTGHYFQLGWLTAPFSFFTSIHVNSPAVHRQPCNLASSLSDSCDSSCCLHLQKWRESHLLLPRTSKFSKARPNWRGDLLSSDLLLRGILFLHYQHNTTIIKMSWNSGHCSPRLQAENQGITSLLPLCLHATHKVCKEARRKSLPSRGQGVGAKASRRQGENDH